MQRDRARHSRRTFRERGLDGLALAPGPQLAERERTLDERRLPARRHGVLVAARVHLGKAVEQILEVAAEATRDRVGRQQQRHGTIRLRGSRHEGLDVARLDVPGQKLRGGLPLVARGQRREGAIGIDDGDRALLPGGHEAVGQCRDLHGGDQRQIERETALARLVENQRQQRAQHQIDHGDELQALPAAVDEEQLAGEPPAQHDEHERGEGENAECQVDGEGPCPRRGQAGPDETPRRGKGRGRCRVDRLHGSGLARTVMSAQLARHEPAIRSELSPSPRSSRGRPPGRGVDRSGKAAAGRATVPLVSRAGTRSAPSGRAGGCPPPARPR